MALHKKLLKYGPGIAKVVAGAATGNPMLAASGGSDILGSATKKKSTEETGARVAPQGLPASQSKGVPSVMPPPTRVSSLEERKNMTKNRVRNKYGHPY